MCYPEALSNLNSDTVMLNEEHGPISTLMYVYTANVQALSGEGGDQWVERDTDTHTRTQTHTHKCTQTHAHKHTS